MAPSCPSIGWENERDYYMNKAQTSPGRVACDRNSSLVYQPRAYALDISDLGLINLKLTFLFPWNHIMEIRSYREVSSELSFRCPVGELYPPLRCLQRHQNKHHQLYIS